MAKAKPKGKSSSTDSAPSAARSPQRALVLGLLQVLAVVGMLVGGGLGLNYLDRNVHAAPRFQEPPVIELVDVPNGLRETMEAKLAPFATLTEFDPDICAKIGRALESDPWVARVNRVRRAHDLRITVECVYRMPHALVQGEPGFDLVDREHVRLPGVYAYEASLPLIQGVSTEPPVPGSEWAAPDLIAGLNVARLLVAEPYAHQITGIQVHNYRGRLVPREAHIVLTTDRAASVIKWGSAPGEEVEENNARQKLAILRHNFERYGHVDAGFHRIDISVYADRFITSR